MATDTSPYAPGGPLANSGLGQLLRLRERNQATRRAELEAQLAQGGALSPYDLQQARSLFPDLVPLVATAANPNPYNLPAALDETPAAAAPPTVVFAGPDYGGAAPPPPALTTTNQAAGAVTVPMAAASPQVAQAVGLIATDPTYAARVPVSASQQINPIKCTSGVCRPTIQAGDFYASATQSGIARDPNFQGRTEFDRLMATAVDNDFGGRQAILANEQARRQDALLQLRQTPQYAAQMQAALRNTGGDPAAAQALVDAQFRASVTDPSLLLALTETNTTPNLDVALSRQAAAGLAAGQAQLANPLSGAAADAGYYGSGILPYGTAPDAPAYLVAGAGGTPAQVVGLANEPETYAFPAATQVGGAPAMLGRADAGGQAILRALVGGNTAASALARAREEQIRWQMSEEGRAWQAELTRLRNQRGITAEDLLLFNQAQQAQ